MMQNKKVNSLYIHIPFCDHICKYCDFTKLFYNQKFVDEYMISLFKEIDSYKINKVETIYIGGGTPTSLDYFSLEKLLKKVKSYLKSDGEFTVEGNVENLSPEKLRLLFDNGVNRLSIGVESTNNKRLEQIGRKHTFQDAINVVNNAKQIGFKNINIDLIYGFKDQTIDELKTDLQNILSLNTDHISIYSLIIQPGSVLYNEKQEEQNQDDSRNFYDEILKILRANGYERYEISNFARNKKYSKHNLTYWHNEEYYGIGLGASGYLNNIRYENTKSLKNYNAGKFISSKEEVSFETNKEYFLLTNLRLESGFDLSEYTKIFNSDFLEEHKNINDLIEKGIAFIKDNRFALSDDGLMIMDKILLELF